MRFGNLHHPAQAFRVEPVIGHERLAVPAFGRDQTVAHVEIVDGGEESVSVANVVDGDRSRGVGGGHGEGYSERIGVDGYAKPPHALGGRPEGSPTNLRA